MLLNLDWMFNPMSWYWIEDLRLVDANRDKVLPRRITLDAVIRAILPAYM